MANLTEETKVAVAPRADRGKNANRACTRGSAAASSGSDTRLGCSVLASASIE